MTTSDIKIAYDKSVAWARDNIMKAVLLAAFAGVVLVGLVRAVI